MSILSQQDLNVRLQLLNCCIGTKAGILVDKIKIGAKDVNCKLQDLQVMQNMLKYIQCYNVNTGDGRSSGSIQIITLNVGFTLGMTINGTELIPTFTIATNDRNFTMDAFVTYINSTQTTYTAVLNTDDALYSIELYGPCANADIVYTTNAPKEEVELLITDLTTEGCRENCLTETQVISMIDWMANKCGICFQPPGFNYN